MRHALLTFGLTFCALQPVAHAAEQTPPPPAAARPIAYLARTVDFWQVWTMRPDGTDAAQVTRSPYEKAHVAWHPDGRRVLVTSTDGRLYEVEVETGIEKKLTLPLAEVHDAEVSPDASEIIFSANAADARDGNEIWGVRFDGSNLRRITRIPWLQHEPSVSPDGAWIYFASGQGQQDHDIFRVSYDGKNVEQITAGELYHFAPVASLAGLLAFSSNRTGDYELWLYGPDEEPRRLTNSPGVDGGASFSPDGGQIVFYSSRTGRLQIFRMDLDGSGGRLLPATQLTAHDGGARAPTWWPPSRKESLR